MQYAALAGDKRTADLAAQKAVDLAPKNAQEARSSSRPTQLKKAAEQQQAAG